MKFTFWALLKGRNRNMPIRESLQIIFDNIDSGYIFDSDLCVFSKESICQNSNNIPRLFRYCPANYNNIRNLEEKRIYLSEAGSMNDIFEGLSCEINDSVIENLAMLNDIAYLKSFTENKNDLLMWATYADNYAGMCIEYDLNLLEKNDPLLYHLFPVIYTDKRSTKANLSFSYKELKKLKNDLEENNSPCDLMFLQDVMGLFITKSRVWSQEKEWRLIVSYLQMNLDYDEVGANDETEKLYGVKERNVFFPCVKSIYLGPRMRASVKQHLKDIGKKINASVHEMTLSHDTYELIERK